MVGIKLMRIYEGSNYNYNYTLGFIIITHDYDSFHLEPSQCTIFFELYTCAKKKKDHMIRMSLALCGYGRCGETTKNSNVT